MRSRYILVRGSILPCAARSVSCGKFTKPAKRGKPLAISSHDKSRRSARFVSALQRRPLVIQFYSVIAKKRCHMSSPRPRKRILNAYYIGFVRALIPLSTIQAPSPPLIETPTLSGCEPCANNFGVAYDLVWYVCKILCFA